MVFYTNWVAGQPNDGDGTQDYAYIINSSGAYGWADAPDNPWAAIPTFVDINGYFIEWDAGLMNDDNAVDTINGDAGNDWLYGYGGGDTLNGGDDADYLFGGAGNDTLNGGAGADYIVSGNVERVDVNANAIQSYGNGQDGAATVNYLDDDVGVELDGNAWKKITVNYEITSNTVLEFDFRSTLEAEISGLGFDNDDNISNTLTFKVYGTQNWGRTNFDNYDGSGDWVHYEINVGAFFTGTYEFLTLVNDDDGGGTDGNGWFRNITLHEGDGGNNEINGGTGIDELYGSDGIDTFVFDNTSDTDVIHSFNASEDILDISAILTGYTAGVSDINDFIQFTNSGDHVSVSVDTNGGANSFVALAEIRGAADLDADALLANSQIVA